MFDLIVKNATLPDGRNGQDIAVKEGVVAAVEAGITAEAKEVIDAGGHLVSPPFVDPHFHMDATLSLGTPRMNVSGTLLEGIALWGELKPIQSVEDIIARAMRYCDLAASMGCYVKKKGKTFSAQDLIGAILINVLTGNMFQFKR